MSREYLANRETSVSDKMKPFDSLVTPLLTDFYQLTMAYAYWKSGHHNIQATFDMFYRTAPFNEPFVIFAGLEECIRFIASFRFEQNHIKYIANILPHCEPEFLSWLQSLDCSQVRVDAQREGSIAYPNMPLMKVSGPLATVQLLETTLLNLVNYASLVTTNAHRFRIAAGPEAKLLEFGLRRAQGPDGAITASKYCYLGGFDATSNVAAGYKFGIPTKGTHAHSFVQSYQGIEDIRHSQTSLRKLDGSNMDLQSFIRRVFEVRKLLGFGDSTSEGELVSFIAFATAYPSSFSALVDTYNTLQSGVPNFMCVALVLSELGYSPLGVRLDSGDLAQLSLKVHELFQSLAAKYAKECSPPSDHYLRMLRNVSIMASNDVTVELLQDIASRNHKISAFGIGTHLVTCRENPALGCVFKLSKIAETARMKFSEEWYKSSIPGDKAAYRLTDIDGICRDVVMLETEPPPVPGQAYSFRTHTKPARLVQIITEKVERLLYPAWHGRVLIDITPCLKYLDTARETLRLHFSQISRTQEPYLLLSEELHQTADRLRRSEFREIATQP